MPHGHARGLVSRVVLFFSAAYHQRSSPSTIACAGTRRALLTRAMEVVVPTAPRCASSLRHQMAPMLVPPRAHKPMAIRHSCLHYTPASFGGRSADAPISRFFLFFATRPPHCARPSSARQGEVPRGEVAPFCGVIACAPRSPLSRRRRREAGTHAAFLAALLRLPLAALLNGSGEPRRHLGHGRRRVHRGHRRPRGRCQARPRGQAQRRGRGAPQWPPARRQPGARCGRPLFLSYPLFPG